MFENLALIIDFRFNYFALFSLSAIIINLTLLIWVQTKGARSEANNWFTVFLLALILWGASEFLDRLSASPQASLFWGYLGRPGWIFIPTLVFGFTLNFIGKEALLKNKLAQILIFGPPCLFLFLSWNTNLISNNHLSDIGRSPWGWNISPVADYFWVFIVWLEAFLIGSLALLTRFYFKTTDPIRKKQTLTTIVALLIPIVGGSLTDAFLPILGIEVLPVAILFTSALSIIMTYGIVKYSLFVISPKVTSDTIIDTMSEALLVIGPYHTIEQVNRSILSLLGFKESELLGKNVRWIIPDVESWDKFLKRVLVPLKRKGSVAGLEIDFKTKGGIRIPVSFSATSLLDKGHLLGIVGLARDIREVRKLINRITAERNKMGVTLGGIVDGVFAVDKGGRLVLFSPSMERQLEIDQDKVLGKGADEVIYMVEGENRLSILDLLPRERVAEDRILATKKNIKVVKRDGSPFYVDLTVSTIAENEDIDLGAIVTMHDVSQEHELEEMKLDFVSMAAHELRTPLTSIRGYLSVLQEEIRGKVSEEQLSFLSKAFISSTQLAGLVENLLSVSRIERGRMKVQKSSVDWVELVNEVVTNYLDQARQKGITLEFVQEKEKGVAALADKFRMGEVLSNLIGNALSYTGPGGKVTVTIEVKGGDLVTSVGDTGQGIPEEALSKLFTKFFRVSGVLEQGSKGTGLGLYISKAIVEMHSGRIWVKSTLGKGSTFSFSIPLKAEESSVGESKETLPAASGALVLAPRVKRSFVKNGKKAS